ncbi:DUF192 domain-containing protein [Candidatus Marsarchaeota archaeon]|jgi:uncharacterized membrane protein (UPF0127 family)|nr:DUF192 domain-containing protein [Candidatus Marsarchaeota archaeon]
MKKRVSESKVRALPRHPASYAIAAIIVMGIAVALGGYYLANSNPVAISSTATLNARFNATAVRISNASYYVYLAVTPAQQLEGYMNSSSTGNCRNNYPCIGMLFEFQNESYLCFWMKNTIIPLRQTWLNENGYPVYSHVASPMSTTPVCNYGKYVIETPPNLSINGQLEIAQNG